MKEWYTNAELADLKMPGFPATEPGVSAWFKKRDLDARFPNKVRRRKGRGGGVERHMALLPRPIRSCLTIKSLETAKASPIDEIFEQAHQIPAPPVTERGELKRAAILLCLNFWDIFRSRFNGPTEQARYIFVTMYRNGKLRGVPDWVPEALTSDTGRLLGVSVNTLRNWENLRAEGKFGELAGKYGNRRGTGVLDTAEDGRVGEKIAAFLVKQPHLTADHIRDLIRDEFGDTLEIGGKRKPVPSLRTFERFIANWKSEHRESLLKLTDPDAWKNKKRFSGTNMNHWVSRPNQLWEIDASPADVLLTDGRYSIYAVIDIYTRRMMVTVTKTPKTAAVLVLVRRAIMAWGVPEILRTDNGSDFIGHEFKRALSALAIHQDITDPFSPEQKGTVERAIGTLQRGLMPLLPGFIGHNVADRKKIETRKSFAQRLGESDEKAFCVELSQEELQVTVDRWLTAKYEHKAHGGLKGKTPFETMAAWTGKVRAIESERMLDVMLAPIAGKDGFRTVTKFGIALDKAYFIHAALVPGMATFHGFSGYGKTSAATYVASKHRCYHIQVKSVWTQKKLCRSILLALGIRPAKTIADMVNQIGEELALSGRPLLVDEADFLVQKRMVEVLRDIYESSAAAIILIGEEHLPGKLKAWERVHGRMLDWVAAQPSTLSDAKHLTGLFCPGIEIEPELLAKLHEASGGSARRICVNLDRIRELARTQGLDRVGKAEWGQRTFFRGLPPHARRGVA